MHYGAVKVSLNTTSYLGFMETPAAAEKVKASPTSRVTAAVAPRTLTPIDCRLIPGYDSMADVVEWVTWAEMLCQLRGVAFESALPLPLTGGAFSVWSQLPTPSRCSPTAVL